MSTFSPTERLCTLTIDEFLGTLAADTPAPAGGAATALAGAMGAALVTMVARLTRGRARYTAHHAEMVNLQEQAEALQRHLADLADADTQAYSRVMAAYKLPKQSTSQRAQRSVAIQAALREAVEVPLTIMAACADVLDLAVIVAAHGNRNATGDAMAGAFLAHAGLRGAAYNVQTNLRSMHAEAFCETAKQRVTELVAAGEQAFAETLAVANVGGTFACRG